MEKLAEMTNRLGIFGSLGSGVLVALLIALAGYFYVISPYELGIEQKKQKIEATEKNVAKLQVLAENREVVEARGAEIYANYLKASKLLPNGEQISQVLEAIEGKAGENGTEVISFDAFKLGTKSTVAPEVYERVVEGELRGNHAALVGFLRSISYYERITEVRAVSAQKNEKGAEQLKFVLAAYYLPTNIPVPDEVRRRALEILEKEGFTLEQPVKIAG